MKGEIDMRLENNHQKIIRWFEKWGHRKWQYVLFHQLPVIAGWNVYWFFSNHDLSFHPLNWGQILDVIIRELPILAAGIIYWTFMKIRSWNTMAFRIGILNRRGDFPVEGAHHLHQINEHTQSRIEGLARWSRRWSERKVLFYFLNSTFLFIFILLFLAGIKMWQKGNAWFDSIYSSEWPVYILLFGLPLVFAIYLSMEIWRKNARDYLSSLRFQKETS
jgi:hypothetical protein